jgi:tetratricopeptide (TPR) repeat protein
MAVDHGWQAPEEDCETPMKSLARHLDTFQRLDRAAIESLPSFDKTDWLTEKLDRLSETAGRLLQASSASEELYTAAETGFLESKHLVDRDDIWEEKLELLNQFAFAAWRCAIALARWSDAGRWIAEFRAGVVGSSLALEMAETTSHRMLESRVELDSYSLLTVSASFIVRGNERAAEYSVLASRVSEVIASSEWPVFCSDERRAIEFEFAAAEARARRCQGDVAAGADILIRLLGDRSWLDRAIWARIDCEVEWLALLQEASRTEEVRRLAGPLIEECNEPWQKQNQMKARLALGEVLLVAGQYDQAVLELRRVSSDPWVSRQPVFWLAARQMLSNALFHLGRHTEAMGELRRAERLARHLGDTLMGVIFGIFRADALRHLGRRVESVDILSGTVSALESRQYEAWAGYARLLLGEVLAELGRVQEAREMLVWASSQLRAAGKLIEAKAADQLVAMLDSGSGNSSGKTALKKSRDIRSFR